VSCAVLMWRTYKCGCTESPAEQTVAKWSVSSYVTGIRTAGYNCRTSGMDGELVS
jgi:hypothetical protein